MIYYYFYSLFIHSSELAELKLAHKGGNREEPRNPSNPNVTHSTNKLTLRTLGDFEVFATLSHKHNHIANFHGTAKTLVHSSNSHAEINNFKQATCTDAAEGQDREP